MPPPIPIFSSIPAATALTVLYGVLSTIAYAYFAIWKYSPYLSAALGAGGKFLGFLLRVLFLHSLDINVFAASTVFITAGMSACTSAQAAVLGDWFANCSASRRLTFHQSHPRLLHLACRLLSIPVLVFGPGLGVPAAILMYGVRTPDSVSAAMTLRKWSAWGTLACLAVLTLLALLALALAFMRPKQKGVRDTGILVALVLVSILLIQVSGATRVRALYDNNITPNDNLYYTLIVLPELLQQLLTTVPMLLHRTGLADSYAGWRTAAWGWVLRAFPPSAEGEAAADEEGKGQGGKKDGAAASSSSKGSISCKAEPC